MKSLATLEMPPLAVDERISSPPETMANERHREATQADLRSMFDANFEFIWRILRRLGVGEENVDDAAQQVFMIAARKLAVIEAGRERSFLLGTALRVAAQFRRREATRREIPSEELDSALDEAMSPEEVASKKRELEFLDGLLESLPFELRTVFVLFEIEGLSTHEIAPLLELPRGTVVSRLRRARDEFQTLTKRALAKHGGGRP